MKVNWLIWIPLLPLIGAAINLFLVPLLTRLTRSDESRGFTEVVAIGSVAAAFGVAVYGFAGPLLKAFKAWKAGGSAGVFSGLDQQVYNWIEVGSLKVELALRLDNLSAVMILIITGVGSLIHLYSKGYMAHDPRFRAYFGYLNLFTGAMLILVLADNLLVMFIGWEGVGLCSYLLIGFWFEERANADAGRKAFIVNRVGDFAFLLGICLLFFHTGSVAFPDMQDGATTAFTANTWFGERVAFFAGVLLFIGACGKSAQIPLYVWLPDAMAGPTPVSALIHAATMVTAGVYMIVRLSWLYASSSTAMAVVAVIGALTALFAAIIAFAQNDLKKVLAYSTVSQLGFMFAAAGVGAWVAAIFHLMTHAFFKAGLFLGAGSVMHAMSDSGDITKMGGLSKRLPWTHITFLIFCLAIAGIPIFAGFFSKDEILLGLWITDGGGVTSGWPPMFGKILWGILTVAAFGTAFYMFRLYCLVFRGECRADAETQSHIHESPPSMVVPLVVLALLAIVAGVLGLPHHSALDSINHSLPNMKEWLEPVLTPTKFGHYADGTIVLLIIIATAVAVVGVGLAFAVYGKGPNASVAKFTKGIGSGLYDLVYNKFYVDEIYEKYILAPFRWTARMLYEAVDRFVIDLFVVAGSAFLIDIGGRILRWLQNGQVQRYVGTMVVGAALVFFFTGRGGVDFDYEQTGPSSYQFVVADGDGPGQKGAEIEWDFDEDGRVDSTEAKTSWQFGREGKYTVSLRVKDGVFKRWREIEKTIHVTLTAPGKPTAARGGSR